VLTRRSLLTTVPALAWLGCRRAPEPPSAPRLPTRLIRANILTNDPARPRAEAMLVHGGEIVAIGSAADLASRHADELHDWQDCTVVPGLVDAHAHLLGLGQAGEVVDLRGASSVDEVLARLRAGAPREGWIVGRGWDQNLWGGAMPTAALLDAVFPDRPVWLQRIDGHAGWANSVVLGLAKIDAGTANPEGGEILRDAQRAATGVLIDNAMALVPTPTPTDVDIERWLRAACKQAAALGLTGVHEMGLGPQAHAIFSKLAAAGELPIRVHGYADEAWHVAGLDGLGPTPITRESRYLLAGVKLYVDGALGSRGAALIEPYSDRPEHRGALMHPPEQFVELVRGVLGRGMQVAAHAIGDLGNRTIIDAYAAALAELGDDTDPRLRVEHAQIVDPIDIARMGELGLIASMQPTHATSDMPWVPARIGEGRLAGAYAWRRMLELGVTLAFGSDFPVEQPSPLLGLHAAVTRQDLAGQPAGGWLADQCLTIDEAIAGFTSGAAYAAHRDDHLGRLAPGYRADVTCLVGDPTRIDPHALPSLQVRATLVDGELVGAG
jgi:hypothetical protein